METLGLVITVIHLIVAVALTVMVLMQSGKSAGLSGALSGSTDTFLAKNKNRSMDARLARWTKWVGVIFAILTLTLTIIL